MNSPKPTAPPPVVKIEAPPDAQANEYGQKVWLDENWGVWVQNPDRSLLRLNGLTGVWEPYEEEENPDPPREYAKNELPEWIKPNPDGDDAATGVIGGILRDISALFNMIFFLKVFVGICVLVMVVFFGDGLQWSFTT